MDTSLDSDNAREGLIKCLHYNGRLFAAAKILLLIPSSSGWSNEVLKPIETRPSYGAEEKCPVSCFVLKCTCLLHVQKYTDTMHLVVMWPIAYTITVLHFIMLCARAAAGSLPVGKMLYCPWAVFCYTARPAMIILNKGLKIIQIY